MKQALWALAGELGLVKAPEGSGAARRRLRGDRGSVERPAQAARSGERSDTGRCAGRMRARPGRDRGQVTIEFLGMMPMIIRDTGAAVAVVLVGYTFTLAGNAADEAVRAATAAGAVGRGGSCERPAANKLPGRMGGRRAR